ncbi:VOC family protein [Pendulispora rubella]|uniref:VOC family protein n=1 Tax=Pendulispora rubella TaxID=2741070 RepID=A0ABZ2KPT2_9BACT
MTSPKATGLAAFGLRVPNLDEAIPFYTAFGLQGGMQGAVARMKSPGRQETEVYLSKDTSKRLNFLSFAIAPGSEPAFRRHLVYHGIHERGRPDPAFPVGIWFKDPWDTWINLVPRIVQSAPPVASIPMNLGAQPARVDVAMWQEMTPRLPLRLGHVLIFTADWEAAERFYADVIGLRTTDRTSGKVAFMAAGEGMVDHHCFGLIRSSHRGFQHASFHVPTLDDIAMNAGRMRDAGYRQGFGPGRHAISSNLFHYVRDPWGSWIEYYADMDKITEAWVARDWNNRPYIWGPDWSPEFWAKEMNTNLEPA